MDNLANILASTVRIPARSQNIDAADLVQSEWQYRVLNDRRYPYTETRDIDTSEPIADIIKLVGGSMLRQNHYGDSSRYLINTGDLILLDIYSGRPDRHTCRFVVAGTAASVRTTLHRCESLTPYVYPLRKKKERGVDLTYWYKTPQGAARQQRRLLAETWPEVAHNYAASTASLFAGLISLSSPPKSGRLILAYGKPGTGKTNSLLTLARSWGTWANINYIMDANDFFADPAYMMQVALQGLNLDSYEDEPEDEFDQAFDDATITDGDPDEKPKLANVIIIEDADELITSDAKNRVGQALSKLLNLTDGLVGRGLNTYVFITTNEPMENLHEAIKRPGRCLANIEFKHLSHDEASAWAEGHNVMLPRSSEEWSLAELYSLLNQSLLPA